MQLVLRLCIPFILVMARVTNAQPAPTPALPEALRPWIDWVMHGHEEAQCPFFNATAAAAPEHRQCAWPAHLMLRLDDRGGRFDQTWQMYRDVWVALPGDARVWPQAVLVDGKPAIVAERNELPYVRLPRGTHTITGEFAWDAVPEALPIPPETGLLTLTVRGETLPFVHRDAQGRVWLQTRAAEPDEANRLEIVVHRRVTDEIPLRLTTLIELRVSGKGREEVLGKALPPRFIPMSLESPLPARLESDGHLRVQVRPGTWHIELTARHDGPATALALPAADGPWDPEEVWVFEARPDLRLVTIEGVTSVDPQQTALPAEWRQLPAYRMRPGDTMTLAEKRRGDADPPPDRLTLQRTWWLAFDGSGYTIHDRIAGAMHRGWRLDMAAPTTLGRVALGGQDQFVTRLSGNPRAGVEIRQGVVNIDADSRLLGNITRIPAVSWDHDFEQVSGELRLPPGWRLFHAGDVDEASPTWVNTWTLLDLFVVLIIALAVARLWGWSRGVLALLALATTYIEPAAPRFIWLAVLVAEGLRRVLPEGRAARLLSIGRLLAIVGLIVITVPFMIRQVREAVYPALERPGTTMLGGLDEGLSLAKKKTMAPEEAAESMLGGRAEAPYPSPPRSYQSRIDPNAIVQTGPGLPSWHWNVAFLRWRGPVEHDQQVHLLLLSPRLNFALAWLRVGLLALLVLTVLGSRGVAPPKSRANAMAAAILIALGGTLLLVPPQARADLPSPDLLNDLRARLLEQPDCYPQCASSPRMLLEVTAAALTARLDVDVAADAAIPLPGNAGHWLPATVRLDGEAAGGLARDSEGRLWLHVPPGTHQVVLQGPLPARDTVQIALPLKPHHVDARVQGWVLEGVHEDGLADDSLQLTREQGAAGKDVALQPSLLPPFVSVRRELRLDLTWQATTTVERITPEGAAIVLEVPLLSAESVTTAGVRIVDGKALVNISPSADRISWQSILPQTEHIELDAPEVVAWTEVWRVDASPMWHVDTSGIPPIHHESAGQRVREWRPWPGEKVALTVSRPEGVPGQTLTVDGTQLKVTPGLRATDAVLDLTLRGSRGGQHTVTLPETAELQSVTINGTVQPIRQEQRAVRFPLLPGRQQVQLTWRQRGGIMRRFVAPDVDIGAPSVNAQVDIAMPVDRWSLWLSGPRLGPAILFWSLLIVFAFVSLALGRVSLTPLRSRHWFLLGLGLTQVPIAMAIIVSGWLLVLGWRRQHGTRLTKRSFTALQLLLIVWTIIALAALLWSIQQGLLGLPQMQITGNGSSAQLLRWYQDATATTLPRPAVVSVPLLVYRFAMLAWALWLAQALLGWLRWGWECFSTGGLLRLEPNATTTD